MTFQKVIKLISIPEGLTCLYGLPPSTRLETIVCRSITTMEAMQFCTAMAKGRKCMAQGTLIDYSSTVTHRLYVMIKSTPCCQVLGSQTGLLSYVPLADTQHWSYQHSTT